MKTIKYDIRNEKVKTLLLTDQCLNQLIKYIQYTELIIEPDGFSCIVKYIIGQQISDKARETLWNKFKSKFTLIDPIHILNVDNSEIKAIGLSERKVDTIKRVALEIVSGNLNFNNYIYYTNEQVIEDLIKIKGIGCWTAEMYLIFSLGRENVLSTSDGTIKRTIKWMYNLSELPSSQEIKRYFEKWKDYETIVSTFLWKSIELDLIKNEFSKIIQSN